MQRTRRLFLVAPLLLAIGAGTGCASADTREFARQLDPLKGKADKEWFIRKYGEPVARTRIDSQTEVWEFVASDHALAPGTNAGTLKTSTRVRATFRDGVMTSWEAFNSVR